MRLGRGNKTTSRIRRKKEEPKPEKKALYARFDAGKAPEFELRGRELIIRMHADLDHHYALQIREKADRLIEQEGIKNIIFDFTGVEFMDSSGIGMIMGRYKKVIFSGGKVGVMGIGKHVDRIFNYSGLYKIVERVTEEQ